MLPMCSLRPSRIKGNLATHCGIWRIYSIRGNHRSLKGGGWRPRPRRGGGGGGGTRGGATRGDAGGGESAEPAGGARPPPPPAFAPAQGRGKRWRPPPAGGGIERASATCAL